MHIWVAVAIEHFISVETFPHMIWFGFSRSPEKSKLVRDRVSNNNNNEVISNQ